MATNMEVQTDQIKSLRDKTGAGMMDCKRALIEAGGNFDKALEILRKKGLADAAKRSARTTKEGVVAACLTGDGKSGAILELNCETDFVAKTEEFQSLASQLAASAANGSLASAGEASGRIQPVAAKLGEKVSLRRFERFKLGGPGRLAFYVHTAGAKKGALVELSTSSDAVSSHEAVQSLAKELTLQIVGMSPRWVSRGDVPEADLAKEREIYTAQVRQEGKPEAAIPKIVEGKINKLFFQAFCLVDQLSMRDNKTPMSQLLAQAAKTAGGTVAVKRFVRYQLGGE